LDVLLASVGENRIKAEKVGQWNMDGESAGFKTVPVESHDEPLHFPPNLCKLFESVVMFRGFLNDYSNGED